MDALNHYRPITGLLLGAMIFSLEGAQYVALSLAAFAVGLSTFATIKVWQLERRVNANVVSQTPAVEELQAEADEITRKLENPGG